MLGDEGIEVELLTVDVRGNVFAEEGERIGFLLRVGMEREIVVVDGISGAFSGNGDNVVVGESAVVGFQDSGFLRERAELRRREKGLRRGGGAGERQHGVITQTRLAGVHVHDSGIHCVRQGFSAGSSQKKKKNINTQNDKTEKEEEKSD